MSANRNTTGAFIQLLFIDVKFLNILHKKKNSILTNTLRFIISWQQIYNGL